MFIHTDNTNANLNLSILKSLKSSGLINVDQKDIFDLARIGGFLTVSIDTYKLENMIVKLNKMDSRERSEIGKNYEKANMLLP